MEIIKIGYNSFKIALNASEAVEYDISSSDVNDDTKMNKSLKILLDKITSENRIDLENDKISAEIYISKDGGCEIFISRAVSLKQGSRQSKQEMRSIYRFERLNDLLEVCSRLYNGNANANAQLYYNRETENYYLVIYGIAPKEIRYAFICEYGERVKNSLLFYIIEHCESICEKNALEMLSKLL